MSLSGRKCCPCVVLVSLSDHRGILACAPNSQTAKLGRMDPIAITMAKFKQDKLWVCYQALLPSVLKHLVLCPHHALSRRNKAERGLSQQAPTCRSKMTELCISSSKMFLDLHRAGMAPPGIMHRAKVEKRETSRRGQERFCTWANSSRLCLENLCCF